MSMQPPEVALEREELTPLQYKPSYCTALQG